MWLVCFLLFSSQIKLFLDILMKEILNPESQSPDGVRAHLIDVYLDELSTVGGREVRSSAASRSVMGPPCWGHHGYCQRIPPSLTSGVDWVSDS